MVEPEDNGDFVVLTDEDGSEHRFEVVDVITVEGSDYAVLAEPETIDEAFVLRVEADDDGNDILVDIEDDQEWERVAQAWEEIQDAEEEEMDEDDDGEDPDDD